MQQANMLHEFEQRRQAVYREVAELRKNRDRVNQELAGLTEEFNSSSSQLEDATARVKALHTRFAVVEKKLKEVRTKTSLLRKKRSERGDEAAWLQREIERAEAALGLLGQNKEELGQRIVSLESGLKENSDALETAVRERQGISARVHECTLKREELSSEIARCLSTGVSEQDRIQTELNDITLLLMNRITERDSLKIALAEHSSAMTALRVRVSALDERRRALEEAKVLENRRADLKSSISELMNENELLKRKIEEQQGLLASREKKLNGLVGGNAQKEKSLADLEDKVGAYDNLVSYVQDSEGRLAALLLSKEQVSKDIDDLLAENSRLDSEIRLLEAKIKAMMDLAGS